jgi:hypothetical protein
MLTVKPDNLSLDAEGPDVAYWRNRDFIHARSDVGFQW